MSELAFVILNYNTWEDTIKEIEQIKCLLEIDYKHIIVVDNKSTNDSEEKLKAYADEHSIVLLLSEENRGYAAGNNIGLRYANEKGYKYAWILNNDILIEDKESAEKMLAIFRRDKKVAVVNPDVLAPDGYLYNRDAKRLCFWDFTFGMYAYKKNGRNLTDKGGYGYIYRPQGCCMIVDLDKMKEIDYMDENTFLYYEESILAERLLKRGYMCACTPEVKIIHNHSKTIKTNIQRKKVISITQESFKYYLTKYREYGQVATTICLLFNYLKLRILD